MRGVVVLAAVLGFTACSREPQPSAKPVRSSAPVPRPDPYGAEFQKEWNDGKSEVAAYRLVLPDGSKGEAVLVTQLQQRSASARIAVTDETRSGSDVFPALNLNIVKRSRTGVQDPSTQISVVVALTERNGLPAGGIHDVSLTRQEWSGQSWRNLLFSKDRAMITGRDYRTGESRKQVSFPGMRLAEDALPLVARRLGWPRLRLDQKSRADVLSSLESDEDLRASSVWMTLPDTRETVETPAGRFRCHRFTATWPDRRTKIWFVQGDPPYRIVRWQFSDGEQADLLGSDRIDYAATKDVDAARKQLGLP